MPTSEFNYSSVGISYFMAGQTFINNFEILQETGSFGCSEAITHSRFRADLGDGYKQSLLFGAKTGLKSWKLTYKTLIQTLDKIGYINESDAFPQADYYWDFYCRYQVSGIPFVIKSLRNGNYYLAEFADESLSYELFATRLFTVGVSLSQRRLSNVTVYDISRMTGHFHWYDPSQLDLSNGAAVSTLPDLIIVIDTTPPTTPVLSVELGDDSESLDIDVESSDSESGIGGYTFTFSPPED